MPLQDRAANVLECLLGQADLRNGSVTFVCHSLGGLVVKKVLLNLQQQAIRRPEAADLLDRVTRVVFAATPHTGSGQASRLEHLWFLAWPSSNASTLVANDPSLRDINVAYRGLAEERRATLSHRVFCETTGTAVGMIVDQASADPGLPGDPLCRSTPTISGVGNLRANASIHSAHTWTCARRRANSIDAPSQRLSRNDRAISCRNSFAHLRLSLSH